jgi:hypothetical protein
VCRGRSRHGSVLKILILLGFVCPIMTLDAAPSAEFIDATHIWRCSISVDPRWWKSWLSRCRWHGKRSLGLVLISSFILDISSVCSEDVSPSILWWTSALRYIHCLWVNERRDVMYLTPHKLTDFRGDHVDIFPRTEVRNVVGILPSTMQSHPRR